MIILETPGGVVTKAWVDDIVGPNGEKAYIEEEALEQVANVSKLPCVNTPVALMPDVHMGYGATVGSVIPTQGAIVPSAVGVDIGCGMVYAKTDIRAEELPDTMSAVRSEIEGAVPHGRTNKGGDGDRGAWGAIPKRVELSAKTLEPKLKEILSMYPDLDRGNLWNHLGTLGTGNHFIEVTIDDEGWVGLMLHSGSRGVGNRIGSYFISKAREECERWMIDLPHRDLGYLPQGTPHFNGYWKAVSWAQRFAKANRAIMMHASARALARALGRDFSLDEQVVDCHHNYVNEEKHFGKKLYITRKGAVSAREGQLGIIPGSMGERSFIVRGRGNRDSYHSCSHGAGRVMSRALAKKVFTLDDHARDTENVECKKDASVLDETPKAYKNIDDVMSSQSDLVEIVSTLKQVVCVKG